LSLSVHWYSSELDHSHTVWEVAGGINTKLKKGLASTRLLQKLHMGHTTNTDIYVLGPFCSCTARKHSSSIK